MASARSSLIEKLMWQFRLALGFGVPAIVIMGWVSTFGAQNAAPLREVVTVLAGDTGNVLQTSMSDD